jgi:ribosomal protein uS13
MARLAGVDIPRDKRVEVALTYIYGVGRTRSKQTLENTGIDPNTRVKDLSDEQLLKLREHIEGTYKVEGDLRREVTADIRRKVKLVATKACVTAVASPCAVSAPRPTLVPVRVLSAPLLARRRPARPSFGSLTD